MQNPNRGSIVLVPFPNSDLRTVKLRPAIGVQADDLNSGLNQLIIAMISSNLQHVGHPSRVLIETSSDVGTGSGLLFDSVVMCDNLATVKANTIARVIGTYGDMPRIDDALRHTPHL